MSTAFRHRLAAAWRRDAWWLRLLLPLAGLFRAVAALRRTGYRRGWVPVYRAPVPVIAVGNIAVGGSGKTPAVIALVEALRERGFSPGVVSRGYGRRARRTHLLGPHSGVGDCGDEALLIYRRTRCPCAVAVDRPAAVRSLLAAAPVDVVISDDGLQHYALARDIEIIMFDADTTFGNGRCLPAGPLREPLSRLAQADFVLSRAYRGRADVPCRVDALVNVQTGERRAFEPGAIGEQVHAVAAIAHPASFLALLREAGFDLIVHAFPDHHRFTAGELGGLGDRPIIMTEKDAVKCLGIVHRDAWYVRVSATLPEAVLAAVESRLRT